MTDREKIVQELARDCEGEAREYLRKAAEESIFYVALGKCLKREMAIKYGLTEDHVGGLLSKVACQLVDEIRELK